jgi:hypothetical protein
MPNTSKSSKKNLPASGVAAKPEFVDAFTPLYLNGVQSLAELQKKSLDVAAEQTAEWISAWKKAFSYFPVTPPTFVFDVAGQAVQTYVETQKDAIDLVVEQAQAVAKINKQRAEAYSKIAETVTATFQTSVERSVAAQQKALDFVAEQNKAICQATKKQIGAGPATVVVDSFESGANTLIETQKSILDAATKPFLAAVGQ